MFEVCLIVLHLVQKFIAFSPLFWVYLMFDRELALRALNSRLKEPEEQEAWPNMEGDGEGEDGAADSNVSSYVEIDMSQATELSPATDKSTGPSAGAASTLTA